MCIGLSLTSCLTSGLEILSLALGELFLRGIEQPITCLSVKIQIEQGTRALLSIGQEKKQRFDTRWNHIWLKEGLATFFQYVGMEALLNKDLVWQIFFR